MSKLDEAFTEERQSSVLRQVQADLAKSAKLFWEASVAAIDANLFIHLPEFDFQSGNFDGTLTARALTISL